ncbi:hypothetical protein B0T17DRAFT_522057 [Bombardia bombarda]|uniref:Transmembrane protein n=1 Tax=Bombardia bombarda TaxID=252184 RepID=A0AA39X6G7_9PEZI|nr:hypothetical protein B0T17DRAFT_522057 [Bombardia bombarda]
MEEEEVVVVVVAAANGGHFVLGVMSWLRYLLSWVAGCWLQMVGQVVGFISLTNEYSRTSEGT